MHAISRMMNRRPLVSGIVVAAGLAAGAGCHGCRGDHPYVPYTIGPGQPVTGASADSGAAPAVVSNGTDASGGDPFAERDASAAPPSTAQWSLDGVTLQAPDGLVFASAITGDFDGDGAREAFAIVRPADGNDPGEALYYRGNGDDERLAVAATFAPPAGLSRSAECTAIDRLVGLGAHSVLVELGAQCPEHAGAPARWVAVLDGGANARARLAVTIADPPGAAALTVDADVSDRDGDGRADVALRVTLEGGGAPLEPGPRVSATLAWLDRPAGLSRDTAVTEASFSALASSSMSLARSIKDAPAVPNDVAQARALWRAACADGGSPRVVAVAGTGAIVCGGGRALEDLGLAVARAYATLGDPLRAALALDRAERPPATHTAARVSEAEKWIGLFAPASGARLLRAVAAIPVAPRGHEPAWGALAFETGGKLLVRTRAGVVRVDPDFGDESEANVADWDPRVTSPDGTVRWIEAYDPCDGLPLRAMFELASGDDDREVALPVAPALAARCAGSRGAQSRSTPVAWGPAGLEAIVEGELILVSSDLARASPLAAFLGQPTRPGAPRSPDGKTYIVPTDIGFIVGGERRTRWLRASDLDGTFADQRDCAVSNDTTHVACIHGGRAWVGTWDAP